MNLPPWVKVWHNYIKIHQFTLNYIVNLTLWRRKVKLSRSQVKNRVFLVKLSKIYPMRCANFPMRSTYFQPILEAFLVSKYTQSVVVGKVCLSNFQNQWNFWIWPPFSPPKLSSPNTASCVSKKGQKGHFWGVFDLFGSSKPVKISWPFVSIHIFPWQIQKCWVFFKRRSLAKARAKWHGASSKKNLCFAKKFLVPHFFLVLPVVPHPLVMSPVDLTVPFLC